MKTTAKSTRLSNVESLSDADVVAALRTTNSDALELLVYRYGGMIERVAAGILRDEAEAEDVAQEIFFEIYRKAHQYDPARGTVRVWLLQYAYHRSLRRLSTLRLRAAYKGEPLSVVETIPIRQERGLTREECRWMLRAGLAQLPERQRTTLELAYIEELSLREIAERLRVSLGCARHYYYRGLARLKRWAATFESADSARPPKIRRRATKKKRLPVVSATDRADGGRDAVEQPLAHD
jgi:RNA polymerase sigma-70 factor, ECF subfamily